MQLQRKAVDTYSNFGSGPDAVYVPSDKAATKFCCAELHTLNEIIK